MCAENLNPNIMVMKPAKNGDAPVCTENLNPNIMVMKPAENSV